MPSATCVSTIPILKELGATHGEPGHALTGTTPLHQRGDQPELPAMVYVSEVSHLDGDRAYVYGGGFYRRSRAREAIVGKTFPGMMDCRVRVRETPPQYIDYYGALETGRVTGSKWGTRRFSLFAPKSLSRAVRWRWWKGSSGGGRR